MENEISELQLHPLCTLFPRLSESEADSLAADIAENGLREPIVIHEGMILDGGNRYRACLSAGVDPVFKEFEGGNLVTFVLSANLHRRHLSPGQQAAIVASAQDWAMAQSHGGNRSSRDVNVSCSSVEDRAAQSGASKTTQKMADAVAKKDPELAKKVAQGDVSLTKAAEQAGVRKPRQETKKTDPIPEPPKEPETPPEPEYGEDEGDIDPVEQMAADLEEALEDNKRMGAIFDADDRLSAAVAEVNRLTAAEKIHKQQIARLTNECNQAKRHAKSWMRKYEALKKEVGRGISADDFEEA